METLQPYCYGATLLAIGIFAYGKVKVTIKQWQSMAVRFFELLLHINFSLGISCCQWLKWWTSNQKICSNVAISAIIFLLTRFDLKLENDVALSKFESLFRQVLHVQSVNIYT